MKVPLTPEQASQGQDPDVRPVAVGETEMRAIGRALEIAAEPDLADVLTPQQLAVGVKGGISVVIHGVRLLLEIRQGFVVVRLDMRNGFNAVSRDVMLRRMERHPRIRHLVPFLHALGAHATDLYVSATARLFDDGVGCYSSVVSSGLLTRVSFPVRLRYARRQGSTLFSLLEASL